MHRQTRHHGSVYLPVLIASMVAATLAVGGMLAVQSQSRSAALRSDSSAARALALSAVEIGRARIAADENWRTAYSTGAWFTDLSMGGGTVSLDVSAPAGALDRNILDPVVLTGSARFGRSFQRVTVMLVPPPVVPVSALNAVLASASNVVFSNANIVAPSEIIAANGSISSLGTDSSISAQLRAKGSITGGVYSGTSQSSAPLLGFPATGAVQLYLPMASTIVTTASPESGGTLEIENVLISPLVNPYGAPNSRGIYVINCGGANLRIRQSRIIGTLIVLNAASVTVEEEVHWTPAEPNLPALLVDADLTIDLDADETLDESKLSPPTNLNPAGSPYPFAPGGATDSDILDSYPTVINGLIYSTGTVTLQGDNSLHTVLSAGTMTVHGDCTFVRDQRYINEPPPGFLTPADAPFSLRYR